MTLEASTIAAPRRAAVRSREAERTATLVALALITTLAIALRFALSTPFSRRPSATLSRTFSHGISACFWNTTPRSAPGPTTGCPSSRIWPVEGGRKQIGRAHV